MADLTASVEEAYDDQLEDTPTELVVKVGNGATDEALTISLSGTDLVIDVLDEWGSGSFDVPIPLLAAGDYTLDVEGTTSTATTLDFTVLADGLDDGSGVVEDDIPTAPAFTVQRWQFIDTTVGETASYVMEANPDKWTTPWQPSRLEHGATTAPDGNLLAWEGGQSAWRFSFSGVLLTQAAYEALQFWSELRRRFWLVDHRGVARLVTFEHFDARARTSPNKPWVHDYTVNVIQFYAEE